MTKPDPHTIDQLKHKFRTEVCNLLLPNHSKGTAFLRFLMHYILKWHVKSVDPFDVLLDGIQRGLLFIEQTGKPIEKAEAWLRSTCLNILKDMVKQSIKDEKLVQNSIVWYSVQINEPQNPLLAAELLEQLEILQEASQQLPASDQQIIYLRFYGGQSYQQIRQTYEVLEGEIISEATLRQRESRALRRLKKLFLKLYHQGADTVS